MRARGECEWWVRVGANGAAVPGRACLVCWWERHAIAYRLADAARWVRVEKKTVGLEALGDLVDAPFRDALALHAVPVKHGQQRLIVRAVEGPADHPTVLIDLRLGCGVGEARGRDAVA